jgi:hypothetical protein
MIWLTLSTGGRWQVPSLYAIAHKLKQELGNEYDEWREQGNDRGPAPDHSYQWHAIRLLLHAHNCGGLGALSEPQIRQIRNVVTIPQEILTTQAPQRSTSVVRHRYFSAA